MTALPPDLRVPRRAARSEQVILFSISHQLFAIAAASVQEIRSTDSLAGTAAEIVQPDVPKVRHTAQRGRRSLYIVHGGMHFGLSPSRPALVFILRSARAGLLVDRIEKMTAITRLYALPQTFCGEERTWYRGLTVVDDAVIPVVEPNGVLSPRELELLDSAIATTSAAEPASVQGASHE